MSINVDVFVNFCCYFVFISHACDAVWLLGNSHLRTSYQLCAVALCSNFISRAAGLLISLSRFAYLPSAIRFISVLVTILRYIDHVSGLFADDYYGHPFSALIYDGWCNSAISIAFRIKGVADNCLAKTMAA